MSVKTLERIISKQTNISKLEQLRNTGLDKMIANTRFKDLVESFKNDLLNQINERIRILSEVD